MEPPANTETAAVKEITQREIPTEKMLAQVPGTDRTDLHTFVSLGLMGAVIFFGLMLGSAIIAMRALRRE